MFKHILLPTDGSELSLRAAGKGIALAVQFEAHVYAIHVLPPFPAVTFVAQAIQAGDEVYSQDAVLRAEHSLADVGRLAEAAGVPYAGTYVFDHRPYLAIIGAAAKWHCDLIVMGSHGRHGLARLLLGSETHKVASSCDIPVLVCH